MKTIRDLQKEYGGIIPLDELDILIAFALNKEKLFVLSHPEHRLNGWQKLLVKYFANKRKNGWPVAYLTHRKEFYGLDFYVNKHALIPRPETEAMVERAIEEIRNRKLSPLGGSPEGGEIGDKRTLLIDVGTGSGCIPISIIKTLKHKNIKTIATDISRKALKVAKRNAKRHGAEIKFLRGNLLSPIHQQFNNLSIEQFNNVIITANLPYLTQAQFASEPSIQREPRIALVAEKEGLVLYEKLLKQISTLFTVSAKGGSPAGGHFSLFIFLEINPSQSQKITSLIKQCLPGMNTEIKKDLAGRDRIVKIQICLNPSPNQSESACRQAPPPPMSARD